MGDRFDVAVVVPLFDKAPFIRRTLESVLAQTLAPREIVIVDDGSTDDGSERIRDLVGGPVRLIRQVNAGPGPARNRGIAEATRPWVAFIDGDDLWRADHLATLAELSREVPAAEVLATGFDRLPAAADVPAADPEGSPSGGLLDYFATELDIQPLWTSCVAVTRTGLLASGGFGAFYPGEDFDLWARLALDHPIARTPRRTAVYVGETDGIMERMERAPRRGFELQPIFGTLDSALANPRYADRHESISRYRERLLSRNMHQALYAGEPGEARAYARSMTTRPPAGLRLLSLVPGPLLRTGLRLRSALSG